MMNKFIGGITLGLVVGMLAISYSDDVSDYVKCSKKHMMKKMKKMSFMGNN